MIKIFLDLDGVLVDFATSFRILTGANLDTADLRLIRTTLDNSSTLFQNAPMLPRAKQLYKALLNIDPNMVFLSSLPYENFHSAYNQKLWWITHHLKADPNRLKPVFEPGGKSPQAADKHCVLIDDYHANITAWTNAGGTGILYNQQPINSIVHEIQAIK